MTNTKHTPGPWKAGGDNNSWNKIFNHGNRPIATVNSIHKAGQREAGDGDTQEANARFIVTACNSHAELLEALKEADKVLELAKMYFPKSIKNGDRFALLNVQANSVRKAIQKAEATQ